MRLSSFLTSSKGSKTTPVNGRVLEPPLEAETSKQPPFLGGESLRMEEEEEENRGPRFSARELARERAEGARRSMIEGRNEMEN